MPEERERSRSVPKKKETVKEFKVRTSIETAKQAELLIQSTYEKLQKLEKDIERRKEKEKAMSKNLLERVSTRQTPGPTPPVVPYRSKDAKGLVSHGSKGS